MRSKPFRKNAHKERIFTLRQNRNDFDYLKHDRDAGALKSCLAIPRRRVM